MSIKSTVGGSRDLTISGTGSAGGGSYAGVKIKGVGTVTGNVECTHFSAMGVAEVTGDVLAGTVSINGESEFGGILSAQRIKVRGVMTTAGDCTAEEFISMGSFTVAGLLSADKVQITLYGPCEAGEIGGANIQVRRGGWRRFNNHDLRATLVEGDDIHLENTKADVVRGQNIVIGPGCEIGVVEYSGELTELRGAAVGESRRI